ncbi:hypothetical protein RB25_07905 [Herbaspirillum rubrisubalbicans]|uniref:DUF3108 domain-containing protein n=1 Tax=Herbaspirillum rubrisubalbicans TaxID=80842 RepID=A0ABX9C7P1_9BURK|nr:hypothetical protein [Herbaspirillum rubrisubalbicans]RAM66958.1 hypothetical protein RB24_01245 [Herbaspirillum rubrisubalbicans]RAN49177.1 hypothetical protein RB25_07905 [Herbaspirillum rubrisubalbicans]
MTSPSNNNETKVRQKRGRYVIVMALIVPILLCAVVFLPVIYVGALDLGTPGPIPVLRTADSPREYVIGDLGGMPVKIDHGIVRYIEYDGDPRPGEKRKGPWPTRTYASRLSSFLFYVRYPDMGSLTSEDMKADFERYHPLSRPIEYGLQHKDPWITGGIQSGSSYPGHGFLDRWYQGTIPHPEKKILGSQLVPMASEIQGLELFVDPGVDAVTGEPWRYSSIGSGDTYVRRDSHGKVATFVLCKYRSGTRRYAVCNQYWSMESFGLNIKVSVSYVPGLLPQWQDIQLKVSHFILSFKAPEEISPTHPGSDAKR